MMVKGKMGIRIRWFFRIMTFVASAVLVALMITAQYDRDIAGSEFIVGEPAPRSIFSPFDISYEDEIETAKLRLQAESEVPPVFTSDPSVSKEISEKVDEFFESFHQAIQTPETAETSKAEIGELPFTISDSNLDPLTKRESLEEARKQVEILLRHYLTQGIFPDDVKNQLMDDEVLEVSLYGRESKEITRVSIWDLKSVSETFDAAEEMLGQISSRSLRKTVAEIFEKAMMPNLVQEEDKTKNLRKEAAEAVSRVEVRIKKNELLVQRGMLLTQLQKEKIDRIQQTKVKHKFRDRLIAISLISFLAYLLCFLYLYSFEPKTLRSMRSLVFFHLSVLLTILLCKVVDFWPGSTPYLMPSVLACLFLTLLMRARLGLLATGMMSIFIAPLTNFNMAMVLGTLFAGVAGSFAAMNVRKRVQFLRIGAAVGGSYFLMIFALRIFEQYPLVESFQLSALGLANGFLITMPICFLLLPLFESFFNLITDISLLELSDLNHPLLKRMIVEAPGTYHHSLVVSTLAESACEGIGANALLARVGGYFHDIGKIARAEYFTENMAPHRRSLHEFMNPRESCRIIRDHVVHGIELGRKHKLKQRILDFIPEHQGTAVIFYFYQKAADQAKPGERVNTEDFRYAGPKPQSRETAVVLLADSAEAASRSLKDPTPESIRQLVRKIINDKFIDGQLDECDLTLKDLHKIQGSFVRSLMAIYHTRVSYPNAPADPESPDLFEEGQFSKFRIQKYGKKHDEK